MVLPERVKGDALGLTSEGTFAMTMADAPGLRCMVRTGGALLSTSGLS